jgi:hypothetical protein
LGRPQDDHNSEEASESMRRKIALSAKTNHL